MPRVVLIQCARYVHDDRGIAHDQRDEEHNVYNPHNGMNVRRMKPEGEGNTFTRWILIGSPIDRRSSVLVEGL